MFKTILISWITTILSIFITFFYNTNNPIIKNELYNSILVTNKYKHTFYLQKTGLHEAILPIKIENITNYTSSLNIDYIVQQNNMHSDINITTTIIILTIIILTISIYKIKNMLYKHEIYNIEQHVRHTIQITILTLVFFKENIINIILKRNITLPEVLFETEQIYSMREVGMLVLYILIYNYTLKKRMIYENDKIVHTKIGIQSITVILLIATAQYSIYEILMVLLYTELVHQYSNVKLLNKKYS